MMDRGHHDRQHLTLNQVCCNHRMNPEPHR